MSARYHEWAWGAEGTRTVCGLTAGLDDGRVTVVGDIGAVELKWRCKNCERMRAAIGASKQVEK
jgi:hypothetical protein